MKNGNKISDICANCIEWETRLDPDKSNEGECIKLGKHTASKETCSSFSPDPLRFCTICNSKTTSEDAGSIILCNSNNNHFASHWDFEWTEI